MSRTNYICFSESFDNAAWNKFHCSISPNVAIAPDGSLTSDKLIESLDGASLSHALFEQTPFPAIAVQGPGESWVASVFCQSAERTQILLSASGTSLSPNGDQFTVFDLSSGTAGPKISGNDIASSTINPVGLQIYLGNGWWRITRPIITTAAGNLTLKVQLVSNLSNVYQGNGSSGLYVWGAQLEPGSIATPYIENETANPLTVSGTANPIEPIITGSAIYGVPLQVGTPQTFTIQLGGVTYKMMLLYRNDTSALGGWTVDIADSSGNEIVQGIPLVTGADLLAQYKHLGFTGSLVVQTTSNPDAVPTFTNLGSDGQLYWVTP